MKKLIFTLLAIVSLNFVSAQTPAQKTAASDFIKSRSESFNTNITPVFVSNIDSVERAVEKADLSYRRVDHIFLGEIKESNSAGGSMKSFTDDKSKPFIYYTIKQKGGQTVVVVISGHNGW